MIDPNESAFERINSSIRIVPIELKSKPSPPGKRKAKGFKPLKVKNNEIIVEQQEEKRGVVVKKYVYVYIYIYIYIFVFRFGNWDQVFSQNCTKDDLLQYFIYGNSSPVSYLLNGFNAAIITNGYKGIYIYCIYLLGTSKSYTFLSEGMMMQSEPTPEDTLVTRVANELIKYVEEVNGKLGTSHPSIVLCVSLADVTYSDTDRTEILTDYLKAHGINIYIYIYI